MPSLTTEWGTNAFGKYLGEDTSLWRTYDTVQLIEDGFKFPEALVDQGADDDFLENSLKPQTLAAACEAKSIDLTLNLRDGYDHSYYFISSFMADHIAWHAARLS